MNSSPLSKDAALCAFAKMLNHLSVNHVVPLLDDDFHYASRWLADEFTSKRQFLDYMQAKAETLRRSGSRLWAELGELPSSPPEPCLILAQGEKENLIATVRVEVEGGRIRRFDLGPNPPPESARRSGIYPE